MELLNGERTSTHQIVWLRAPILVDSTKGPPSVPEVASDLVFPLIDRLSSVVSVEWLSAEVLSSHFNYAIAVRRYEKGLIEEMDKKFSIMESKV